MTEKIGEGALVAIKNQSTEVVQFKVPAAPKSKKYQMQILTEEHYIEVRQLSTISSYNNHLKYVIEIV